MFCKNSDQKKKSNNDLDKLFSTMDACSINIVLIKYIELIIIVYIRALSKQREIFANKRYFIFIIGESGCGSWFVNFDIFRNSIIEQSIDQPFRIVIVMIKTSLKNAKDWQCLVFEMLFFTVRFPRNF